MVGKLGIAVATEGVMNHILGLAKAAKDMGKGTEEHEDNMGFIDEMGGTRYGTVTANVKLHGFKPISLAEVPAKLRQNDVIILF